MINRKYINYNTTISFFVKIQTCLSTKVEVETIGLFTLLIGP